jgi:hypothetical protein
MTSKATNSCECLFSYIDPQAHSRAFGVFSVKPPYERRLAKFQLAVNHGRTEMFTILGKVTDAHKGRLGYVRRADREELNKLCANLGSQIG